MLAHLGALVTADVLQRRARADGRPLPWVAATVSGGLADQFAVEEDLVREGLDRAHLGREAFAARVEEAQTGGRGRLGEVLAALGVTLDVAEITAAGDRASRAAGTAFVRLFDEGLVVEADRVVDVCSRCVTVVAGADAVPVDIAGEVLVVQLPLVGDPEPSAHVAVRCIAPELLPGVVAVAVPEGHPAEGGSVIIPVGAITVPVVTDPSVAEPVLVVPAHDPVALDLSRRIGLPAVQVLDADGTVRAVGPLDGLARYAARAAARQLLEAERAVVAVEDASERAARCLACGTVLVPRLGRHWFLSMGELATAAADAMRDGQLNVAQTAAREELLRAAAEAGEWCLSQQLWVGEPVPTATCRDCGHKEVSVEPASSCGRCMGDLVADTDVLDARFVRCMWPMAASGWPDGRGSTGDGVAEAPGSALLVVAPDDLRDVVSMAALGLRLTGAVPFGEVTVAPAADPATAPDEGVVAVDVRAVLDEEGPKVLRVALACGELDLATARRVVASLDAVPVGEADVDRLAEFCAAAFAGAIPASALGMIAAALGEGVPPGDAVRLRTLAAPFVGE